MKSSMRSPINSWKAWLLVAVIFLAGAAAGAFGMRLYMARHLPELLSHTRQRLEEFFLDNIDREVGLTEQQRQAILPILREAVGKGEKIRQSVHGQLDSVMQDADARIAAQLTPEQRVKFLEFRARMERLRRQGPPPPGFPPGPPPGMPPGFPPGPPPMPPATHP